MEEFEDVGKFQGDKSEVPDNKRGRVRSHTDGLTERLSAA